jgi:hypothetical protein
MIQELARLANVLLMYKYLKISLKGLRRFSGEVVPDDLDHLEDCN